MKWDYRVVRSSSGLGGYSYEVAEVFYDESAHPISFERLEPIAYSSFEDLQENFDAVAAAFKKPQLDGDTLKDC